MLALAIAIASCAWAQDHAEAARRAQQAGDFAAAVREYGILVRQLPDVAEAHSNLGVAYFFNRQPAEAIAAFDKALALKPDLVPALLFSGIAHHDLSHTAKAIERLEAAVKLSPADPLARTSLGFSYSAAARFAEAAEQFRQAAQLQPGNADAWYGLGAAYVELGKRETRRLAETAPGGAAIRRLAADLWRMRGDEARARQLEKEAAVRHSTPGEEALYRTVTEHRRMAQAAFENLPPGAYRTRQVNAESLAAQHRTTDAIAEYREVLRIKPDLAGIREEIGDLLMSEGKAPEALAEYRLEQRLRPNSAALHYRIGRALAASGEDKPAEAALRQALASGNAPPGAMKELAKLRLRTGDAADAAALLNKYVAAVPGDAPAHYLLMRAYSALGDRAASERHRARFRTLSSAVTLPTDR